MSEDKATQRCDLSAGIGILLFVLITKITAEKNRRIITTAISAAFILTCLVVYARGHGIVEADSTSRAYCFQVDRVKFADGTIYLNGFTFRYEHLASDYTLLLRSEKGSRVEMEKEIVSRPDVNEYFSCDYSSSAVFVASETYGEVIKTRIFEDFCTEQELKLWVCNKADPESKGPIENSVGFVKKNFFSARNITCIDDVWRSLPGWLNRKNKRIHRATLHIPASVFRDIEQKALKPLLPSVYESSPNSFTSVKLQGMPYVLYKSCRYSVPREYAYSVLKYKTTTGKIHIYDENLNFICTHLLSERKGSYNQLPEHRKGEAESWMEIAERMRAKWNCYDFQHFINGVKKENPRHIAKQLGAIEQFLDAENPERSLVAEVLKICCKNFRYQFSQFKVVFEYTKAGRSLVGTEGITAALGNPPVDYKQMDVYSKAFEARVARAEQGVSM